MEVTAVCIPRARRGLAAAVTAAWLLLVARVDFSSARREDVRPFPRVVPNRLQHFKFDSLSVSCEGLDGLTGWRAMRRTGGVAGACKPPMSTSVASCDIENVFPAADSGEYWCEKPGKRSNVVDITVTDGLVILESPVHPVLEGDAVTLSCRDASSSNLTAEFFKDGLPLEPGSAGNLTIGGVSSSYEGRYKCKIPGVGESAESWLSVASSDAAGEEPDPDSHHASGLSLPLGVGLGVPALLLLLGSLGCWRRQTSSRGSESRGGDTTRLSSARDENVPANNGAAPIQSETDAVSSSSLQSSSAPQIVREEPRTEALAESTYAFVTKPSLQTEKDESSCNSVYHTVGQEPE